VPQAEPAQAAQAAQAAVQEAAGQLAAVHLWALKDLLAEQSRALAVAAVVAQAQSETCPPVVMAASAVQE
jgi:hypothetical protein